MTPSKPSQLTIKWNRIALRLTTHSPWPLVALFICCLAGLALWKMNS